MGNNNEMGYSGDKGREYDLDVVRAARNYILQPSPEKAAKFFEWINCRRCFISAESGPCEECSFFDHAKDECGISDAYQQSAATTQAADFCMRLTMLVGRLESLWGVKGDA